MFVYRCCHIRIVRVWMMAVEELHDMEAEPVHIEVDVPLLEIRRDGLPHNYLWVQVFHRAPRGIADALR